MQLCRQEPRITARALPEAETIPAHLSAPCWSRDVDCKSANIVSNLVNLGFRDRSVRRKIVAKTSKIDPSFEVSLPPRFPLKP